MHFLSEIGSQVPTFIPSEGSGIEPGAFGFDTVEAPAVVSLDLVVEPQLPGYEGAVILPERVQAVLQPVWTANQENTNEFARALGYELEDWQMLQEQIEDRLPDAQAVLLNPGVGAGAEWETTMLMTGPSQIVCYVSVKWLVPITQEATTFLTVTVERSSRNDFLRAFGTPPRGDPLLMLNSGLVS